MATYTSLNDVDVPLIQDRYGLPDDVQIEPLKGGAANSSFMLDAESTRYVLTILDNHDYDSAMALAKHTRALFDAGYPTTRIVPSVDGELVTLMGTRLILLKGWIDGHVADTLDADQIRTAGSHLARLHNLPADLVPVPVRTRRLTPEHHALIPDFADQEFAGWLQTRLAEVTEAEQGTDRALTLCHGDLFTDNLVLADDGAVTILDWETISLDDPVLDLGMAALGLAQVDGVLSLDRLGALISGYATERPQICDDLGQLGTEIVHAALIIAFHRYYRHNVRFPDPSKAMIHRELYAFVDSVPTTRALAVL
ncbi:phosphotransferase [Myceligenerans xiligouense]|uniref:Homoserine kinase n=1 Tax=Myceligenerans xiligouense TaxID=253184 RepID=A0A3N4YN15_9MICO|nr:phosphotransferase [Myceligenerans xiligouense]RPF21497.1 homoserine kinase [Myceligenerans xiligouense]